MSSPRVKDQHALDPEKIFTQPVRNPRHPYKSLLDPRSSVRMTRNSCCQTTSDMELVAHPSGRTLSICSAHFTWQQETGWCRCRH